MKYAKWKAVEIDKCLKNGITPTPGPPGGFKEQDDEPEEPAGNYGNQPGPSSDVPIGFDPPSVSPQNWSQQPPQPQPPQNWSQQPPQPQPPQVWPQQPPQVQAPQNWPQQPPQMQPQLPPEVKPVPRPRGQSDTASAASVGRVVVGPGETAKAQKYCKFASSAMDYDDVEGAIDYLSKALNLLKTGKEN